MADPKELEQNLAAVSDTAPLSPAELEQIENIRKELDEVIRMSHVFTEEIQGTTQQLTTMLDSARTEIDSAARQLAAASSGLDERLTASLSDTFRMFDSNMAQITSHLSTTVSEIEKTTERVPEVVLAAYNSMKQSFDDMQTETNALVRSLENINKQ
jgi:predicted unusual protein kinase regulating ubiquinone biosynthesis (AarF/ABC1/UbiB family)